MLYDRSVNSSGLFLVPHEETGSRFFVRSSLFCHPKSTHYYLISNADTGRSDLQTSFDDVRDEDGYDCKGMISLVLH